MKHIYQEAHNEMCIDMDGVIAKRWFIESIW